MVWVIEAKYLKEYQVWLKFNNGQEGVVDLKETIFQDHRAIFQALKDPTYFRGFTLDADTLVWDNGLDLAPEFLYEHMKAIEPTSVSL